MREFLRITLVCVCAVLLVRDGWCAEDVVSSEVTVESEPISTRSDDAEQRRDRQSTLLPAVRRIILFCLNYYGTKPNDSLRENA
ncbi:hypothetical protein RR46_11207 [Papilio xuthus]|uniref:Secreted protein n=1 Tax=Papilio xuthus TaxID=66420 RepID=A0A194PXL6_PAPXU|nr:hypothetical protein RR46_11207 [Papilio xuthus]